MDSTQLWVVVLAIVCVILAVIVFYALRRLILLRSELQGVGENLKVLEDRLASSVAMHEQTVPQLAGDVKNHKELMLTIQGSVHEQEKHLEKIRGRVEDMDKRLGEVTKKANNTDTATKELFSRMKDLGELDEKNITVTRRNNNGGANNGNNNSNNNNNNGTGSGGGGNNNSGANGGNSSTNNNGNCGTEEALRVAMEGPVPGGILAAIQNSKQQSSYSIISNNNNNIRNFNNNNNSTFLSGNNNNASVQSLSFSVPPNIFVYHQTTNPLRASSIIYKKKRMSLQFSVGPGSNETAIALTAIVPTGGVSLPSSRYGSTSGTGATATETVLLFLDDILHVYIALDVMPVDESDCLVINVTIQRDSRSTAQLQLLSPHDEMTSLPPSLNMSSNNPNNFSGVGVGGKTGDISTSWLSSPAGLVTKSVPSQANREKDPVKVVLYAPLSATVEEWVQFFSTHLDDRVTLGNTLI